MCPIFYKSASKVLVMKILVTGGLGFIGSNFILKLLTENNDYEIINVDAELFGADHKNLSIIKNSELILKSLLYLDQIDGLYISKPNDFHLSKGQVNDGINSNKVGLKGIPYISETIGINRDLSILEYVGGKIHFSGMRSQIQSPLQLDQYSDLDFLLMAQ